MDGLASLAAAADFLGEYDGGGGKGTKEKMQSPSKQKRGAPNPETPKKKRAKKGPSSPHPVKSPHRAPSLPDLVPSRAPDSPMPTATTIDLESHGLGNESLLSSITQRFSANVLHWCTYEWFYATIDREYFSENEFNACLQCLGVEEVSKLARTEWSAVRTIMGSTIGRPRRFSSSFVKSERVKLREYRQNVRAIQSDQLADADNFPYEVFPPITVGDCVTAYHAESGLLIRGQVLTLETCYPEGTPSYRVQFEYPVMFTGIVRDEDLALHGELIYSTQSKHRYNIDTSSETGVSNAGGASGQGTSTIGSDGTRQWEHAATLQYFLDRKEYLLESLKVLNNLAEQELMLRAQAEGCGADNSSAATQSQFTEKFLQQHQWVIDNVMRSDHIITQLLQQLNSDASLQGHDVITPPSPTPENSLIQNVWNEQYHLLRDINVPVPTSRDNNSTGFLLGGDALQPQPHEATGQHASLDCTVENGTPQNVEEDMSSVLELYKICVCCLSLLRKFQLEDFCKPKDLCEFLVSKVDGYNDLVPMRNVVQKIEAICFGLS